MEHLKTYSQFNSNIPIIESADIENFKMIFTSLYKHHLTMNEKMTIESDFGLLNESWFSDLADKGKRGVLAIKSRAGELLVDLAKKAKDVLDFAKQMGTKIINYVKNTFPEITEKVKSKILSNNEFVQSLKEFLDKKDAQSLNRGLKSVVDLVKYITSGKFFQKLLNRLSECFSKVLSFETNEGITHFKWVSLNEEAEGEEKKSFLNRLGEAVMKIPPFSWLPKLEDLIKKGILFVGELVDRFFRWIEYGEQIKVPKLNEEIDLSRGAKSYGSFKKGPYGRGIYFLFQLLELYVFHEINGRVGWVKKIMDPTKSFSEEGEDLSNTEIWSNEVKGKTMQDVWKYIGLNTSDAISKYKNAVQSIPYVGDIITILNMLFSAIGVYLALEPTLKKVNLS